MGRDVDWGWRMTTRGWIDPKNSCGSVLEVDGGLFSRLPQIIEAHLRGRYEYKSTLKRDAAAKLTECAWVVSSDGWQMQLDAGLTKKENRLIVMILAHPEGEQEVRSAAKLLLAEGARWLSGINP